MKYRVVVVALAFAVSMSCVNAADILGAQRDRWDSFPDEDAATIDFFKIFGAKKKRNPRSKTVGDESEVIRSSEIVTSKLKQGACLSEKALSTVTDKDGFYNDSDGEKRNIFIEFGKKKKKKKSSSHENTASDAVENTQQVTRQCSAPVYIFRPGIKSSPLTKRSAREKEDHQSEQSKIDGIFETMRRKSSGDEGRQSASLENKIPTLAPGDVVSSEKRKRHISISISFEDELSDEWFNDPMNFANICKKIFGKEASEILRALGLQNHDSEDDFWATCDYSAIKDLLSQWNDAAIIAEELASLSISVSSCEMGLDQAQNRAEVLKILQDFIARKRKSSEDVFHEDETDKA